MCCIHYKVRLLFQDGLDKIVLDDGTFDGIELRELTEMAGAQFVMNNGYSRPPRILWMPSFVCEKRMRES